MDVRSDRTPPAVPAAVASLVLSAGVFPATLDALCDPQRGVAKAYQWQTSPYPMTETSWASRLTTRPSPAPRCRG